MVDKKTLYEHINKDNRNVYNEQIFSRNIPSGNMVMNFSSIPVSTKCTIFPILNNNISTFNDNQIIGTANNVFNSETNFFPGTDKPHFNGFSTNIDRESMLRNQFFALQKADQSKYIPSSNSDLYLLSNNNSYNIMDTKNNKSFTESNFNEFNPNISNKIGNLTFNNSTRVQLKNI